MYRVDYIIRGGSMCNLSLQYIIITSLCSIYYSSREYVVNSNTGNMVTWVAPVT